MIFLSNGGTLLGSILLILRGVDFVLIFGVSNPSFRSTEEV